MKKVCVVTNEYTGAVADNQQIIILPAGKDVSQTSFVTMDEGLSQGYQSSCQSLGREHHSMNQRDSYGVWA